MSKGDYTVVLTCTTEHRYFVPDANTPEEAISIAEQQLEAGDTGEMVVQDVATWDAILMGGEGNED